jgi:hypothetical protein
MARKIPCAVVKKINSQIRSKLRGALADLNKGQCRSASTKLYQAGSMIRDTTKGIWTKNAARDIGNDASWVSFQLCKESTMRWPKWKDRTEAMLAKVELISKKTIERCTS